MEETILFPSPNWFLASAMAVSTDEWLVYGGPSKSLCVLEPLPQDYDTIVKDQQGYKAHVVNRAHQEKIVCVDICPEWPEKRLVLTGSSDGVVKQWSLEKTQNNLKMKSTHSHELHCHEKEEVIGVGYCKDGYAVTVGGFGVIVKWDLNSNVAKSFNHVLKNFKPSSMACSPHIHMHVAIGTKQGVLFVLDLNGSPRIIYKVRGQDDEILKVSWCPQYEVAVRKALKEYDRRTTVSSATRRMEQIRQDPTPPQTMKELDERVKNSQTAEKPIKINEKSEPVEENTASEVLEESGIGKTLPEDSFDCDETIVQEDDMFDIYKDHEADEFGHKKYQPVDILVKVPDDAPKDDYLSECEKLKDEILKRKMQSEATIETLVDAMDKAQVVESKVEQSPPPQVQQQLPGTSKPEGKIIKGEVESSVHIHNHLLATIGKQGSIRIWSKSGKLVGSCAVPSSAMNTGKNNRGDKKVQGTGCTTLLWCLPDSLIIADGKSQVLECNPLKVDCKNKLEWTVLHTMHKRGLYAVASSAARVQRPENAAQNGACAVWSAAQDRMLVRYCLRTRTAYARHTCGGFVYMLQPCPYDANKMAIAVGDGAVRIWEAESTEDETKMNAGNITSYWQNVQGKVLTVAWHPTRENLLAFATAEARVGLLDISGKNEKPAKVLPPAGAGGVYSLCWAEDNQLYATSSGELLLYDITKPDQSPTTIAIELEGQKWEVSEVVHTPRGIAVGSCAGAVAVADFTHKLLATAFIYKKMIHTLAWHPQEISSASEPSPYKDLIAVCSLDRNCAITILEYEDKEDSPKKLTTWKTLTGHKGTVLQVAWNPHQDELLLSTSQDATVRVWDVTAGTCMSIFGGHAACALGCSWAARPAVGAALSGGSDCALRLWPPAAHLATHYQEIKHEVKVDKKKKTNKREKKEKKKAEDEDNEDEEDEIEESVDGDSEEQAVASLAMRRRHNKKFMFPMIYKQTRACDARGPKILLQRYLEKHNRPVPWASTSTAVEHGMDYIKIFGTINELNDVLATEMERHQDTGNLEAWALVCVARGYLDACIASAAHADLLDPFLLSIAPAVSFKFWKDTTMLYLQQMDRLIAKGEESKLSESKTYGGPIFRKMATLLSLHDIKGAVTTLLDARLFLEAYILSRTRYTDSLAEQSLRQWAKDCVIYSQFNLAATCYIALGELSQAAAVLSKSSEEEALDLAAHIAAILGHTTFAGHMEEKRDLIKSKREQEQQETLPPLPSRADRLLKDIESAPEPPQEDTPQNLNVSCDHDLNTKNQEKYQSEHLTDAEKIANKAKTEDTKPVSPPEDNKEAIIDAITKSVITEVITEPKEITEVIIKTTEDVGDKKVPSSDSAKEKLEIFKEELDVAGKTNVTEELIDKLPASIESVMKLSPDEPLLNGTHKGDGDTLKIQ